MITFDDVSKVFPGGTTAVDRLSFDVQEGETLVLLGTSGSGKTTSMKMINRLIEPTSGMITIENQNIMDQDPVKLRRGIGYAIQHIGLFPHMTVGENIAVVPTMLKWERSRIDARIEELLALVGLTPRTFRGRYPNQLSGGQRQRIGVARALAADPPIILMDEPFGALDPITREQLQDEFLELESEIQKTIIFVTHDVFEAVKMGDRIALLDGGQLQQIATPHDLVEHPANTFVDTFLGQHRFQLSLVTRNVGELIDTSAPPDEAATASDDGPRLHVHDSLIQALDAFKRERKNRLPVVHRRHIIGHLARQDLTRHIAAILNALEQEEE